MIDKINAEEELEQEHNNKYEKELAKMEPSHILAYGKYMEWQKSESTCNTCTENEEQRFRFTLPRMHRAFIAIYKKI